MMFEAAGNVTPNAAVDFNMASSSRSSNDSQCFPDYVVQLTCRADHFNNTGLVTQGMLDRKHKLSWLCFCCFVAALPA